MEKANISSSSQQTHPIITGIIHVHARGFGFVEVADGGPQSEDIFIPRPYINNAIDGDTVEVQTYPSTLKGKGPEGRVLSILKRARTHLAGTVIYIDRHGMPVAYAPMLGEEQHVYITASAETLRVGDRVVLKVLQWGSGSSPTNGELARKIGHISDPSCDIQAALEEYELPALFPEEAVAEAQAYGHEVTAADLQEREDIRQWESFTIDPDTAKDFDDALSIRKDAQGHYHLGVHIADVAHYVTAGSALDREAKKRCNSTYFPGKVIPMLPPALSDNLCSLKPHVDRLTMSVFAEFDSRGTLLNYRLGRSVINSKQRFTYREVKAILDGEAESKFSASIFLMKELCLLLKQKRNERGSIDFAMPEARVVVDEKGVPTGIDYIEYDLSHQLVEEFMLKANEIVAKHLSDQGKGLTFRIHEEPDPESKRDFIQIARSLGFKIPENSDNSHLQKVFDEAKHMPFGKQLATCFIRSMKLAYYSPHNVGHYGLSLEHYCHFTSPIRRYADLVIQRLVTGANFDAKMLQAISDACSSQERLSAKAETSVVLLKKIRLLSAHHQEVPDQEYEAIITRVKPAGISFEIAEFLVEGFIHISQLDKDYFSFNPISLQLVGQNTGKSYQMGQRISVRLISVDLIRLETVWMLTSRADDSSAKTRRRAPKSKRGRR